MVIMVIQELLNRTSVLSDGRTWTQFLILKLEHSSYVTLSLFTGNLSNLVFSHIYNVIIIITLMFVEKL